MTAERDSMSLNEVSVPALGVEERSDEAPRAGRAGPTPDPEVMAKPSARLLLPLRCTTASVRIDARLDSLEEISINDGLVSAWMHPSLVDDHAEIEPVPQQLKERAAAERPAAG